MQSGNQDPGLCLVELRLAIDVGEPPSPVLTAPAVWMTFLQGRIFSFSDYIVSKLHD